MLENSELNCCDKQTFAVRCRLCRKQLLASNRIKFSHWGKAEPCGNCLFLDEDFLPDWIKDEIEKSSWTKGRLKCPRAECTARVGGFDFVQGLLCACGEFTIPAVWIQDGKVDVRALNSNDAPRKDQQDTGQVPELKKNLNVLCPMQQLQCGEMKGIGTARNATLTDESDCTCSLIKMTSRSCSGLLTQNIGVMRTNTNPSKIHERTGTDDDIRPNMSKPNEGLSREASEGSSVFAEISVVGTRCGNRSYTNVPEHLSQPHKELSDGSRGKTAVIGPGKINIGTQYAASPVEQHRTSTRHKKSPTQHESDKAHAAERIRHVHFRIKPPSNRFGPLEVEELATENSLQIHNSSPDIAVNQYHLTCAVCLDYFYQPYECPCSHVFCESCLRQLYHNRAGSMKCPICREPVKYIQPANRIREEIRLLQNPSIKEREQFEKTARHKKWLLPPIGPFPFLRKRQTLVPSQDRNLVILASILLLVICYTMLYILPWS